MQIISLKLSKCANLWLYHCKHSFPLYYWRDYAIVLIFQLFLIIGNENLKIYSELIPHYLKTLFASSNPRGVESYHLLIVLLFHT